MTSAMVTELSMQAVMLAQSVKQSASDELPNFADFMKQSDRTDVPAAQAQTVKAAEGGAQTAYEKADKRAADSIAKDAAQAKQPDDVNLVQAAKKLDDAGEEIVQEIAEELGVSEEDVERAMEVLGLTVADLVQQSNMTQLIAQITDAAPVEIVTDAELFSQMEMLTGQVTQTLEEVAQELGTDPQTLLSAIEEAARQAGGSELSEAVYEDAAPENTDMQQSWADKTPADKTVASDAASGAVPTEAVDKGVRTEDTVKTSEANKETPDINTTVIKTEASQSETEQMQSRSHSRGKDEGGHEAAQNGGAGVLNGLADVQDVLREQFRPESAFERFSMQQTQDIIDQIADYVKVNHSQQLTEMEIQLNPANLGTIHLQVASKAGVVSAQLIAQDQAVAAALEGHIVQLKESLEAQGMKVDAVEVTVASHEFEQNLDGQGKQQEEEAKRMAGSRSRRRTIDLNEMPEDGELTEEELSDADRLQIEMMRMGGNRLNFQV